MKRRMVALRAALVLATAVAGMQALPAEAIGNHGDCRFTTDDPDIPGSDPGDFCLLTEQYRWAWDRMPLAFKINTAGAPLGAAAEVRAAFAAWEAPSNSALDFVDLGTTTAKHVCDGVINVYWEAFNDAYAKVVGGCGTDADGNRADADIALSTTATAWETSINTLTPALDVQWAVMHEIGHAFGLAHIIGCDWLMGVKKISDQQYVPCPETNTVSAGDALGARYLWPNGWRGPYELGSPAGTGLADRDAEIASWGEGRLDVFAVGDNGDLYATAHRVGQGWGTWGSLGKPLVRTDAGVYLGIQYGPGAVSWGNGRIDVFVVGGDNALWHRYYSGGAWSTTWTSLGGFLTSSPDVASWGSGRLDVFARGGDGAIWHKWYDLAGGGWSTGWVSRGGETTEEPGAVSWGTGRVDLFAVGTDSAIWHRWYANGTWSAWTSRGGQATDGVDPASWGTNRIDVFTRCNGTSWDLCQLFYDGAWQPMAVFGHPRDQRASPGAVSWRGSVARLDVVTVESDIGVSLRSYSR